MRPSRPLIFEIHRGLLTESSNAFARALLGLLHAAGAAGDDLDACALDLAARDRAALSSVYDAARETRAFMDLVGAPPLLEAVREAIGAKDLHAPFQHCVFRMDMPSESWRSFAWHQDLPYNVLSDRSVTVWTPITPTGPHNGSIKVAAEDSDRIYPVEVRWKRTPDGKKLGGRDAFIPERFYVGFEDRSQTLDLDVGDAVLFDARLVHRSGHNPGPKVRFSVQARFGDLFASEIVARRWANRRRDGFHTFKALHPDLIEHEEQE